MHQVLGVTLQKWWRETEEGHRQTGRQADGKKNTDTGRDIKYSK